MVELRPQHIYLNLIVCMDVGVRILSLVRAVSLLMDDISVFRHLSRLQVLTGERMVVTWSWNVLGVFALQKNLQDILLKGFKKSWLPLQFRMTKH